MLDGRDTGSGGDLDAFCAVSMRGDLSFQLVSFIDHRLQLFIGVLRRPDRIALAQHAAGSAGLDYVRSVFDLISYCSTDLINAVGELVIQQAMLSQRVLESGLARSSGVALGLEDLELLTREIQDSVMAIRAQPVKSVFQRMPRLVREVADMVSKQVRLVTAGEDTEVDKTVVERLAEPITHMLRNAIDHGLETPDERIAAGKPAAISVAKVPESLAR